MRKAGIVSLLIGVILFSCAKDQKQPKIVCPVSTDYLSEDMAGFKVKKSSYWVFIDSISLTIDSVYVDSVLYSGFYPKGSCTEEVYEAYAFRTKSSATATSDIYQMKGGMLNRNVQTTTDVNAIVHVDYVGGTLGKALNTTLERKDSLFIYDRYHKNVEIISKSYDDTEQNKTIYYTNSESGFLKKEIYSVTNVLISKKILKSKHLIK